MMMNKVKSRVLILMLVMALTVTGMAMPATAYGAEDTDTQTTEEQALAAPAEEAAEEEAAADTAEQTPADDTQATEADGETNTQEASAESTEPVVIDLVPTGLKAETASYDQIRLTWDAVEGVTEYKVFVSADREEWTEYETVTGTECVVKELPTKRTRYFKVVSVVSEEMLMSMAEMAQTEEDSTGYAADDEEEELDLSDMEDNILFESESEIVSGMAQMEAIDAEGKLAKNKLTATLSWDKVPGAVGYVVYRYSGVEGKYVWIKTVYGADTLQTTIEPYPGYNNYYKVYAYRPSEGSNVYSPASKTIVFDVRGDDKYSLNFKAASIKLSGKRTGMTKAKLSWTKVSGADGYGIFRYDGKSGKYVWYKGVKGAGTTSTTITVPKGNNMYYKVRAYKTYKGKKIWTPYSTTQRINKLNKGELIVGIGKAKSGCRYVWGAAGPNRFDCSGFTMYVMKQYGYSLPHNAAGQYNYLRSKNIGTNWHNAQPGDLVFYSYGGPSSSHHVGIYVGNGKLLHASSSHGKVVVTSVTYTNGHIAAICRP